MANTHSETILFLRQLLPRQWHRWLIIFLVWTGVGFLSAVHWHLFYYFRDPWTWWDLVRVKLLLWYEWGAITPFILWLGSKYRLETKNWPARLGILFVCSVVVTGIYLLAYTWLLVANMSTSPSPAINPFANMLRFVISQHSTYYILAFWATIGLEQALIYYRHWHEREMLAAQLQAQLTHSQLQALRAQLNPHFLFNILNTVSYVILNGEREKAYDLIAKLGELLRISLERGGRDLVTLEEELDLNERYLELMSARFESRLNILMDTPSDTLHALVPDFILQPLVENALKHGVAGSSGVSTITIRSACQSDRLVLEVEDASELPGSPVPTVQNTGSGHRLTQDRLRCLYGVAYSFSTIPTTSNGMRVRVELPLRFAPGAAVN